MERIPNVYNGTYPVTRNGQYRLEQPGTSITVKWDKKDITPAGKIACSVDGDPGEGTGEIDLSATGAAGSRTLGTTGYVFAFLDIDVTDLPEGGSFILTIN